VQGHPQLDLDLRQPVRRQQSLLLGARLRCLQCRSHDRLRSKTERDPREFGEDLRLGAGLGPGQTVVVTGAHCQEGNMMSWIFIPRRDAGRQTPTSFGSISLGVFAGLLWSFGSGCNGASSEPPSSPQTLAATGAVSSEASPNPPVAGSGAAAEADPAPTLVAQGSLGSSPAAAPMADASPQPSASGSGAEMAPLSDAGTPPLPAAEPSYQEIIASDWELAPGDEIYLCLRKTADADLLIHQFRTLLPPGTHHLGLYVSPTPDKQDGMIDCSLLETGAHLIVGAGPGSSELSLPPGVALRINKGDQLLLQLHLLNPSDAPLPGHSVVQGVLLPEEALKAEADVVAAQLLTLVVPPGQTRAAGRCTFDRAQTLIAFGPHMHETGRHAKIVLHRANGGDQVLRDGDFDFSEQRRYPLDPVEVAAGDYVDYECSFENTTNGTIYWGQSASDEMCLVNLYRFPAGGETLCLL